MEFVAATNNEKKLVEIRRILEAEGHIVKSMADVGVEADPQETGETFAENALIKAREVCQLCQLPTLADDSGLAVDVLDGAPGVNSARFAGNACNDEANNRKLLRLLERTPYAGRGAQFVSVVAFVMPDGSGFEVEGRCEGRIGFTPVGTNGFGYDPLFFIDDCSFADMSDTEKDAISHRAVALRRFVQELPAFVSKAPG